MQIRCLRFRVSGGFAGLVRGADVDAADLSPADCRALDAAASRGAPGRDARARDAVTYEIQIETDEGVRQIDFDEFNMPHELAGLINRLVTSARPVRP